MPLFGNNPTGSDSNDAMLDQFIFWMSMDLESKGQMKISAEEFRTVMRDFFTRLSKDQALTPKETARGENDILLLRNAFDVNYDPIKLAKGENPFTFTKGIPKLIYESVLDWISEKNRSENKIDEKIQLGDARTHELTILLAELNQENAKIRQRFEVIGKPLAAVISEQGFLPELGVEGMGIKVAPHFVSAIDIKTVLEQLAAQQNEEKDNATEVIVQPLTLFPQPGTEDDKDAPSKEFADKIREIRQQLKEQQEKTIYYPVIVRGNHYVFLKAAIKQKNIDISMQDSMTETGAINDALNYALGAAEMAGYEKNEISGGLICTGEQHDITNCPYYATREIALDVLKKNSLTAADIKQVKLTFVKSAVATTQPALAKRLILDHGYIIDPQIKEDAAKFEFYQKYILLVKTEEEHQAHLNRIRQLALTNKSIPFVILEEKSAGLEAAIKKNEEIINVLTALVVDLVPSIKQPANSPTVDSILHIRNEVVQYSNKMAAFKKDKMLTEHLLKVADQLAMLNDGVDVIHRATETEIKQTIAEVKQKLGFKNDAELTKEFNGWLAGKSGKSLKKTAFTHTLFLKEPPKIENANEVLAHITHNKEIVKSLRNFMNEKLNEKYLKELRI